MGKNSLLPNFLDVLDLLEEFGSNTIRKNNDEQSYSIDLPGVDKSDVTIKTTLDELGSTFVNIEAKRKDTGKLVKKIFALDHQYDPEKCTATMVNGVLSLVFEKKAESKAERIIQIK